MTKNFLASAAMAALAMGLALPASANTLFFQMNPNIDTGGSRSVFVFGQAGSTGSITNGVGFSNNFTLGASGFAVIDLPLSNELANATVENKGFKITSDSAISGYYLNRRTASTDMTYLIDGDRLGTDHFAVGYQNIRNDQISVQAAADNTVVTFRPVGSAEFQVTLNAGQTYMFTAGRELTGSRVLSDKPIAVFSGNACTNVPTGVSACDHIVEQVPSVDKLSSSYLLAQTPRTGTLGNVYRAVATQDGTELRANGTVIATLNAGQFFEGRVAGGLELVGSKPIMVAQYLVGQGQAGANTDPAMVIVPGSDQWLKSYVFASPSGSQDFPTDFVSIVIRTTDLGTLRLDGTAPDTASFQTLGSTAFSFGNIDVSLKLGAFAIEAVSPFQLLLSGFDSFDSYFTYGGAAFSPGASPPPPPPPPPTGTRVYWDGTGPANNSVVEGGTGTWTTASTNFTDENGVENGVNNPQPSTVIFGGTGGVVTVSNADGPVTVTGMTFNVNGYEIAGDPVTLSGSTANFTVNGADNLATISARLSGPSALQKLGSGTLNLTNATNDFSGGVVITEGTLRGGIGMFGTGTITNNANLILDAPVNGTLANLLAGTGTTTKIGAGALNVTTTNSFSGSFVVNGGSLNVSGGLAAAPILLNAGLLSGTGTIGGFVAATGTTVAPGPVIGTLTSTGNGSFLTGSTYAVDVTSTGTSDRIAITGTVNVAAGTTLRVTKTDAPRYVLGTRYTVVTTTGGRTGSFATLTGDTRVSRFINVVQETDANNIYLGVRQTSSFASAAATRNQREAAGGADSSGNGALYTAIAYLDTDAQAQAAFDQISGEIHSSARGQTVQDTRFVREAVSAHLQSPDDSRRGLWMSAYGSWGRTNGDGNAAKIQRDIGGFFMGYDVLRGEEWAVGALAGYGSATIDVAARGSRATTDDIHVGAYGGLKKGNFIVSASLVHMWRNMDTRRNVSIPGFTDTLTATYQGNVTQLFGEVAYQWAFGKAAFEPFLQGAYVDVSTDGIREVGGAARLTSTGRISEDFFVSTVGARLKYGLPLGNGNFGVTAEAGYRRISGGSFKTPIDFNLPAGPVMRIAGVPFERDVAALGLVASGQVGKSVQIDFGYRGQLGKALKDHGVRGGVTVQF
ncbi:autotransporter domain-containing protein [Sandarakinorhabdus limnophila]|uniref:autotransporter domain-containing protein n=1 Tax=Sandarakinorhabdus limnophila TaxID=210512 RepID=UPI0026E921C7|nr:autotransporter domain-containing protein [Sandarakinorhabdus limnophila]